jgi:hypothetical protein
MRDSEDSAALSFRGPELRIDSELIYDAIDALRIDS